MNRIASIAFLSALCACSGEKSNTPRAEGKNKIAMIRIDDSFRGIPAEASTSTMTATSIFCSSWIPARTAW